MLNHRKRGNRYYVRGTARLGIRTIKIAERAIAATDDQDAARICREIYDVCVEGILRDDGLHVIEHRLGRINGLRAATELEARVYAIWAETSDLVKFGYTVDVRKRFSNLRAGSPDALHLLMDIPGGEDLERELHFRFRDFRVRGEWFKPGPPVLELLARFANVEPMPDGIALRLRARTTNASTAEFDPGSTSLRHS